MTKTNKNEEKAQEAKLEAKQDPLIQVKQSEWQEAAEFKEKYLRLFAEFENARKRNVRERVELIKYAHEEVIIELLDVVDDFERSVEVLKKKPTDANVIQGIEMVKKRLQELLEKYDVKPIEAVGKKFDPNAHEALAVIETDEHEDGQVIEEFQKGYCLADRVVRTAKVKVAKNKSKT